MWMSVFHVRNQSDGLYGSQSSFQIHITSLPATPSSFGVSPRILLSVCMANGLCRHLCTNAKPCTLSNQDNMPSRGPELNRACVRMKIHPVLTADRSSNGYEHSTWSPQPPDRQSISMKPQVTAHFTPQFYKGVRSFFRGTSTQEVSTRDWITGVHGSICMTV